VTDLVKAVVLGIVEGLTEFLPVSSTGHLKLCERWFGEIVDPHFANAFDIFIQIGAIAAVVVYFRRRILQLLTGRGEQKLTGYEAAHPAAAATQPAALPTESYTGREPERDRTWAILMVILGTLPLAVGYFAAKKSDKYLEAHPGAEVTWIALALAIGGVAMVLIELFRPVVVTKRMEGMTWKQALAIGACQILAAVFPGTSRSAATIMPGLVGGLSRETAAEFSFFLAIPAMTAACGIKLLKFAREHHTSSDWMLLTVGTLVSFLVAWVVIAGFMGYIRRHSFTPFGIYRILLAAVVWFAMR
jgi:undecaprenyl-diphosphatase